MHCLRRCVLPIVVAEPQSDGSTEQKFMAQLDQFPNKGDDGSFEKEALVVEKVLKTQCPAELRSLTLRALVTHLTELNGAIRTWVSPTSNS